MSRKYAIITDSTTDMGKEYYEENDVFCIGFHYILEDKEYIQYTENAHSIKEFYDIVRNGGLPKTSQVSYDDLMNVFTEYAEKDMDIFYICFSSALSGSYQTCLIAKEDMKKKYPDCNICIVDSISACGGEGMLLNECVKKRDSGCTIEELADFANDIKYRILHVFTVDDLNHLHRGGRLSKMSAVMGTMLGIKPILYFNETGHLLPYTKIRGRKQSLDAMAKQMQAKYIPGENEEIFINHADAQEDAEYLGKLIMKLMPDVKSVRYGYIGAVIGSHTGANTIALFFKGKDREPAKI